MKGLHWLSQHRGLLHQKGRDLNAIGAHLDRETIAGAILKPHTSIAESWVNAIMADGLIHQTQRIRRRHRLPSFKELSSDRLLPPASAERCLGRTPSLEIRY